MICTVSPCPFNRKQQRCFALEIGRISFHTDLKPPVVSYYKNVKYLALEFNLSEFESRIFVCNISLRVLQKRCLLVSGDMASTQVGSAQTITE